MIDASVITHEVRCADSLGSEGLALLPDKSCDHIICDPPYEAEAHAKVCRANTKGPGHGKSAIVEVQHDFAAITEEQRCEVARQTVRISRGWVLIFCQIEAVGLWRDALVDAGAKWRRGMVWNKPDAMPQVTGDRPGQWGECIALAWAGTGRSVWNGGGRSGHYDNLTVKGGQHPTQKPLDLMEALVRDFSDPDELICDPFAGSCTTLVAAKRLGRRAIGWEKNPEYFESGRKRLEGTREQLRFVIDELACEQLDLLTGERVDLDTMERVEGAR